MAKCNEQCEVYSRVVGYYRPVKSWNTGKAQEFKERKEFNVEGSKYAGNSDKKNKTD